MPFYLYQASYSSAAVKAMLAHPSDRKAVVARLVEAAGGKLHHMFFAFGNYDMVALIEGPDDKTAAAAALAVAATGVNSAAATTKLLTPEEAMEAIKAAGRLAAAYTPPTA